MVDLRKTIRSFRYAGRGLADLFRYENNAKIHALAAVAVVGAGVWVRLSPLEWAVLVIQIGLVFAAEAVNTALEKLADRLTTQQDPLIRAAKDLAAGAVLITAITAIVVAALIFGPKFIMYDVQ
jgi:diacylglycerol kinase (ATP)